MKKMLLVCPRTRMMTGHLKLLHQPYGTNLHLYLCDSEDSFKRQLNTYLHRDAYEERLRYCICAMYLNLFMLLVYTIPCHFFLNHFYVFYVKHL